MEINISHISILPTGDFVAKRGNEIIRTIKPKNRIQGEIEAVVEFKTYETPLTSKVKINIEDLPDYLIDQLANAFFEIEYDIQQELKINDAVTNKL